MIKVLKYVKEELISLPTEVINNIEEITILLNKNYGSNRKMNKDLGGYILILENRFEIEILKEEKLQGLLPEYVDIIECSEGVNWTSSLFLLSSDFSIVVITTEELSKFLLK